MASETAPLTVDDGDHVTRFEAAFDELVRALERSTTGRERFALALSGEVSDFVRMNRGLVRQAGSVTQGELSLTLSEGARAVTVGFPLTLVATDDHASLDAALARARATLPLLPEDPHLIVCDEMGTVRHVDDGRVNAAEEIVDALLTAALGLDLVGILARGPIVRAVATSSGRRGFFAKSSFHLDWSVVASAGRAVKQSLAGATFEPAAVVAKLDEARALLPILAQPAREIPRGEVRAYLAPDALVEILDLLAWSSFGKRAIATQTSALTRLAEHVVHLSSRVTLRENIKDGGVPPFHPQGFACADRVSLIESGRFVSPLVSPRSSREYGVPHTGHDAAESAMALDMDAGDVEEPLSALGNGVWLSNLWYLNFSDRRAGRITGMTRHACLVVEDGVPVAPLAPMRFDDTVYRVLGERLLGLTRARATILSASTYERRAVESRMLPGALVDGLRFTL